ncbi:TRAP transporter substrate-binding protein [Ornithinibacillus sp. BX22]|uniref:TRAP transporter substrate-binding protein n=2 Tax=Ornithinibacillus TaxID=484508 RepID=A0A923RJJ0_9BACI|nr:MULTISPECIES: TRAP transporter substrate-binding protein [Ornithinibacillus]MBC5638044.1 TRAP transporter substrate-binding protein [Ornithinibacillus hominis]MBS3681931.1 TRAP transporter substrate-binding protein [Ornithinibacillus massiliensis]
MKKAFQSRSNVLFMLVVGFGIVMLAACGSGASSDSHAHELDFSHFFPPTHFMEEEIQSFAAELEEKTDGRIKITSYPGAALAAPDEHFDAAATGSVDFALSVHGYTPGEFPLTSVMELPFMAKTAMSGSENLWKLMNEFDEFDAEYAGTVPLWLYTTDPGQLFTVDKPVKRIEDLKGMKIRSPSPETSEWLEALGATPVSMPMNENFEALERGVVDGTIAPWEAVKTWGLDEVINYATVGNFYSTTMFVVMNEDVFNRLNQGDQDMLLELAGERMAKKTGEVFDQYGRDAVEQAKVKGVEIYELSSTELAEWNEFINPTIESWINQVEGKGLPGQAVYDRAVELSGQ